MNKRYMLFNDLDKRKNNIQESLYEFKYSLWLSRFWCAMISDYEFDLIKNDRDKQFDVTVKYLSELLKNWEIKMAILFKEWRYPREDEYDNVPIVTPWELNFMDSYYKEYDVNNYKEWIDDLRSEWNREMTEDERRLFEDWNVCFTLPENKFFILEWSWEKRN